MPFPETTVLMVMDFAENFSCFYQQEVQAAHWHHNQATVHPTVTYYKCLACEERVTESLVFITSDKTHDYNAVHVFTARAVEHLKTARGVKVDHIVQWTDGCGSQYKSKGPFADISCAIEDFGATMERNFFGSRHGKGPSDGESAVVKSHASRAVKAGNVVIANAADLYGYCQSSQLNKQPPTHGCGHSLRSFFFVSPEDICRNRRLVKTVPGTRSFHSVRCIESNQIHTRHLTCTCLACNTGVGACSSAKVVGPWTSHSLRQTQRPMVSSHHPSFCCL